MEPTFMDYGYVSFMQFSWTSGHKQLLADHLGHCSHPGQPPPSCKSSRPSPPSFWSTEKRQKQLKFSVEKWNHNKSCTLVLFCPGFFALWNITMLPWSLVTSIFTFFADGYDHYFYLVTIIFTFFVDKYDHYFYLVTSIFTYFKFSIVLDEDYFYFSINWLTVNEMSPHAHLVWHRRIQLQPVKSRSKY